MPLVIDLKPGEKFLIGDAVITNDNQRTRLHIEGKSAIMRERDVLKEEDANTPAQKIYFLVQCMYLARNPNLYHANYFKLVRELQDAAPTMTILILSINEKIIEGSFYKALREARTLIEYEKELVDHAKSKLSSTE